MQGGIIQTIWQVTQLLISICFVFVVEKLETKETIIKKRSSTT
jgi:hypothetical protein